MNGQVRMTTRFRELVFMVALTVPGALAVGCDATRRNWGTCFKESCHDGFACVSNRCVPASDGGPWDANPPDTRQGIDGATSPSAMDGSPVDLSFTIDAGDDVPVSVASVDGAAELDSATEAGRLFSSMPARSMPTSPTPRELAPATTIAPARMLPTARKAAAFPARPAISAAAARPSVRPATPACRARWSMLAVRRPRLPARRTRAAAWSAWATAIAPRRDQVLLPGRIVRGLRGAGASACAVRNPAQPVCMPGGTCAECATSDDCKAAAKPICDTSANVCVACTSDDQCQAKAGGPGVCMFQQDGHCATDAESIYVGKNGAGTCSDSGAGSAQMPYCTAQKPSAWPSPRPSRWWW
jgi:hypothetical protein